MEVRGQLHTLIALPPKKESWYALTSRLGGPYSWSGNFGGKKNLLPLL